MVGAARVEQLQRQLGPLGELRIDQASDQPGIDLGSDVGDSPGCQERLLRSARSVRRAVETITVRREIACRAGFPESAPGWDGAVLGWEVPCWAGMVLGAIAIDLSALKPEATALFSSCALRR
jgi:hypothetical protein